MKLLNNRVLFQVVAIILGGAVLCPASALAAHKARLEVVSGEKTHVFNVDVATTVQEKMQGLMFVEKLPEDEGMLFVEPKPSQMGMWMKNTLIPLDMLFVDEGGTIVHIEHEAEPQSLKVRGPGVPVVAVVELAGGVAARYGIRKGDVVQWHSSDMR